MTNKIWYYKVRVSTEGVESRWLGRQFLDGLSGLESDFFLRSDVPFSPFPHEIGQGFVASQGRHDPEYPGLKVIFHPYLRSDNEMKPDLRKSGKIWGETPNSKILRISGPTPMARGGFGAKAPPLAARPKQHWQAGCWLDQCVLKNTLAGSKTWFLCPGCHPVPSGRIK